MHRQRPGTKRAKPLRGEDRPTNEYVWSQSVADFLVPPSDTPIDTRVERPTADGRRVHAEVVPIAPPSPVKRQCQQESESQLNAADSLLWEPLGFEPEGINGERYNMDLGGFYPLSGTTTARRRRPKDPLKPSDKALFEYRPLRDEYLAELLRLDGCGNADQMSRPGCQITVPTIRCRECFGGELYCPECCVRDHQRQPLHIMECWDGKFFQRTSLKDLGLRVQFGHAGCVRPQRAHGDFVVLDIGYIHRIAVDFCGCTRRAEVGEHRIQLLRRGWFPATHDMPKTAAMFHLLDFFHVQTLQDKTTMFDFSTSLEKLTDASGTAESPLPNRYREFLRMTRAYRNLLMLKCGGRGHDPGGVNGTQAGELAIQCPACPRPGVNLPKGWENTPKEKRFLYILFLALEACFRLKRRLVSSDLRDLGLGTGWAYFVENEPYRQYLLTVTDQNEMSTCSGLAALDYANTKFSRGYSATGANGVGDLQKGEWYANMDWIFSSIMQHKHEGLEKVISYDIVCQWWKKLVERLLGLPGKMCLAIVIELLHFVIPKMHIHSHTLACQLAFSLNFLLGAGQTDGEGIEHPWANIGGVASSTWEMGPGSRRDVLDDHWAFWNWNKLVSIGALLRKRLDNARQEREAQSGAFEVFSAEQADRVPDWEEQARLYDASPRTAKNPYEIKMRHLTEAEVKLKFAEEEQAAAVKGVPAVHDVSPSSFIYAGLDLEEEQRRVRVQVELKKAGTTAQKIDVLSMRRKLSRGIIRFRKLQATYSPGALQALSRLPDNPNELPEDVPLMLPSALSPAEREAGCIAGVHLIEILARDAQCSEALVRLRNQLHVKSRLLQYKEIQAQHQGANTRSRTLVARNESTICLHSERYQAAWDALRKLRPEEASGWRQLLREDVRTMEDAEELSKRQARQKKRDARRQEKLRRLAMERGSVPDAEDGSSSDGDDREEGAGAEGQRVVNAAENKRQVTWIWTAAGTTGTDAELEEALRIEWTKARARSKCWKEEVALLEEEYRRVLASFEHEAGRWEVRAQAAAGGTGAELAQGKTAYALKQAQMYRKLVLKVTVAMTEIHRGRGCKRIQVHREGARVGGDEGGGSAGEEGGDAVDREGCTEGEGGRAEGTEGHAGDFGDDSGTDEASEDDGHVGNVHSNEEFFMGGEAEDD
ncbi:CxC2 domain-containing protein [Mycena sanguinolenta]|uniref:CxC2 domain-containing protein n=1 Tax=Mycena sanguinolenta TaxID=230812 RepID=A0A8H6ZIY6_9AGAR|nr:CxC2 domain-containing protein [Mycena sanguinolenta]